MSQAQNDSGRNRQIKSFVRREGRLTRSQRLALVQLFPRFALPPGRLHFAELFGRVAPVSVEIGFGNGESLLAMALAAPAVDFVGIEVYRPGIGHLLAQAAACGVDNLRVIEGDAVAVLSERIVDDSVNWINVFFPDPWPKKRHHKRRLIQRGFVATVADKLRPGGWLHLATDWAPYAEYMQAEIAGESRLQQIASADALIEPMNQRPKTKFECRGERLGHAVCDLYYRLSPS